MSVTDSQYGFSRSQNHQTPHGTVRFTVYHPMVSYDLGPKVPSTVSDVTVGPPAKMLSGFRTPVTYSCSGEVPENLKK